MRGPIAVWLRRPGLAEPAAALGEYCRYGTTLGPRLAELAILVTARHWDAEFEWWAHARHALAAGLEPPIIEAIRTHQPPPLTTPEDHATHAVATTLLQTRHLDDATYAHALAILGEPRLIDLIGVLGYYALVSMTLNAFQIPIPEGEEPALSLSPRGTGPG